MISLQKGNPVCYDGCCENFDLLRSVRAQSCLAIIRGLATWALTRFESVDLKAVQIYVIMFCLWPVIGGSSGIAYLICQKSGGNIARREFPMLLLKKKKKKLMSNAYCMLESWLFSSEHDLFWKTAQSETAIKYADSIDADFTCLNPDNFDVSLILPFSQVGSITEIWQEKPGIGYISTTRLVKPVLVLAKFPSHQLLSEYVLRNWECILKQNRERWVLSRRFRWIQMVSKF